MGKKRKVVLFNKPLWIALDEKSKRRDTRKIIEIWGFQLKNADPNPDQIQKYIDYLSFASIWQQLGNTMEDYTYTSRCGKVYINEDSYIENYRNKVSRMIGIDWDIYETSFNLDSKTPGMLCDADFISSKKIYDNICKWGSELDVRKGSEQCNKWGSGKRSKKDRWD